MRRTDDSPSTFASYLRRRWFFVIGLLLAGGWLYGFASRNVFRREWYDDGPWYDYLNAAFVVPTALMAIVLVSVLPAHHLQLEANKRARRLARQRKRAASKLIVGEDTSPTPFRARLIHAARASRGALVVAGVIEAFLIGLLIFNARQFMYGNVEAKLLTAAFFIALLPVWMAYSLWGEARDTRRESSKNASAAAAFERATEDRAQLAGGLVLDEHARGGQGGELTVQVEAGGLEVNEEVRLGLGAQEEVNEDALEHSNAHHRS